MIVEKTERTERLEMMADQIHNFLRTDLRYGDHFFPSPFMIEFTGSPDSGKTTCITELDKFLRRHDFRVLRPQEGAEVIRHVPRSTPEYNLRTGLYALEKVIDYSYGHAYDIVIFDRCIFDTYGWMMYWDAKGLLKTGERERFQNFFLSSFWADRIIAAYVMICDTDEAIRRGQRIALSDKLGETSNPETITKLVERYRVMSHELAPRFPQIKLINTTEMDEAKMVEHVAMATMETLLQKAREGRKHS